MKLTKPYLKSIIKESLEEIGYKQRGLSQSVANIMGDVEGREQAMLGKGRDEPLSIEQTKEILRLHHVDFEDLVEDLGEKGSYKISELFGWLGY
jgi:hypothetical protein